MFKNLSLRTRLLGGFLFTGLLVLLVGLVGWSINLRLTYAVNVLSTNSIPSIIALWKINEGQTQIESSERALINNDLDLAQRDAEIMRIKKAWQQIDGGFQEYESTNKTEE
ncbi:MAG: Tar ligand binding domain-containing protein, partial [Dolichospermum sp.]